MRFRGPSTSQVPIFRCAFRCETPHGTALGHGLGSAMAVPAGDMAVAWRDAIPQGSNFPYSCDIDFPIEIRPYIYVYVRISNVYVHARSELEVHAGPGWHCACACA